MCRLALAILCCLSVLLPGTAGAQRPDNYPRSYDGLIAQAKAEGVLTLYSCTDIARVSPVLDAFRALYPDIKLDYQEMRSTPLNERVVADVAAGKPTGDIVWCTSMDQLIKLINDGYAQAYASPEKPALPADAVWKNMGYGITAEPVAIIYNKRLLDAAEVPRTRADLEQLLRSNPERFRNKIATFDPARAGVGYLHLQQDQAQTRDIWDLVRAMAATGGLSLFTRSEQMISGVAKGELAIAYNVLGSYALEWAKQAPDLGVIFPRDYTLTISRIALIPDAAAHPASGKLFLDFLLSREGQRLLAERSLTPVRGDLATVVPGPDPASIRPVRVGPQLLADLDPIRRQRLLATWTEAVTVP
jgi:iron(III) transport system substrate-binding protein